MMFISLLSQQPSMWFSCRITLYCFYYKPLFFFVFIHSFHDLMLLIHCFHILESWSKFCQADNKCLHLLSLYFISNVFYNVVEHHGFPIVLLIVCIIYVVHCFYLWVSIVLSTTLPKFCQAVNECLHWFSLDFII